MKKFTHPDAPKQTAEVSPQFEEMYRSQGWVEDAEKPAPEKPDDKK